MVLCGTKNGSSMAPLEEPFEAPLFLRLMCVYSCIFSPNQPCNNTNFEDGSVLLCFSPQPPAVSSIHFLFPSIVLKPLYNTSMQHAHCHTRCSIISGKWLYKDCKACIPSVTRDSIHSNCITETQLFYKCSQIQYRSFFLFVLSYCIHYSNLKSTH